MTKEDYASIGNCPINVYRVETILWKDKEVPKVVFGMKKESGYITWVADVCNWGSGFKVKKGSLEDTLFHRILCKYATILTV